VPPPPSEIAEHDVPTAPAITIAAGPQSFTTSSPPGHVWFEVTNAGAAGAVDVVALQYVGDEGVQPLAIARIETDDVVQPTTSVAVPAGVTVLDLTFDRGPLPQGLEAYPLRLRAQVDGHEIAVDNVVRFARRERVPG